MDEDGGVFAAEGDGGLHRADIGRSMLRLYESDREIEIRNG